jgi:thiamine pyrophosphate-dependent acetolactate synthase large subunit-like protein
MKAGLLHRREVVKTLLSNRKNLLVVAGLGSTSWDITAAGDSSLSFPTWGAMGQAAMIGLGLAVAQPTRRVLVITGDGEMLMGMGSLATIGVQQPPNLALVVIDNERYGETGGQPTHTAHGVDLAAVAKACGFKESRLIRKESEVETLRDMIHAANGPLFAAIKVIDEKLPLVLPPNDGVVLKERFRRALLGPSADVLAEER